MIFSASQQWNLGTNHIGELGRLISHFANKQSCKSLRYRHTQRRPKIKSDLWTYWITEHSIRSDGIHIDTE